MSVDTEDKKAQLVHHREEEILAAAKRIFAQNGFRRTKIDQIAEELNVGKGTIYRYFKDKKSLFLAVFEQGMASLSQTIKDNVAPITDPQIKVAAAVRTYFEFFENDRQLIEILMQVRSEFKDDYKRVFIELYKDYIVRIQNNLRNGIEMGLFRRELDVERTAEAMTATLHGILQSFYLRGFASESAAVQTGAENISQSSLEPAGREVLTDRTEAVTELLLNGILKRNESA